MINRIRIIISDFIRKNKDKLKDLGKKLIIVAMIVCFATIILSSSSNVTEKENENDGYNSYKPTDTIIQGSNISEEQYKEDSNLINTFLDYCNNKKIEEAYNLISDECKEERYSTIEKFKEYYYNKIFDKKRECVLQSWISSSTYIVYKVRYTNNMLATGTYDVGDVYQDYITLNRKNDTEKISIGSFVDSKKCNITTKTEGIEATVVKKKVYIEDEEYEFYVKNNTDKTILLDNLESSTTIKLVGNNIQFRPYFNEIFITDLIIKPGEIKRITIKFMKDLNNANNAKTIKFFNVIKDYDMYKADKEVYKNIAEIKIKVVD